MNKKILSALTLTITMMLSGCGQTMPETYKTEAAIISNSGTTAAQKPSKEISTVVAETDTKSDESVNITVTEAVNANEENQIAQVAAPLNDDTAPVQISENIMVSPTEDRFTGNYRGDIHTRATMNITKNDDGSYNVHIRWSGSCAEAAEWDFSGEIDGRQVLHYNNCTKKHTVTDENGNQTSEVVYTNGTGFINITQPDADKVGFGWKDDMEDEGKGVLFVKE